MLNEPTHDAVPVANDLPTSIEIGGGSSDPVAVDPAPASPGLTTAKEPHPDMTVHPLERCADEPVPPTTESGLSFNAMKKGRLFTVTSESVRGYKLHIADDSLFLLGKCDAMLRQADQMGGSIPCAVVLAGKHPAIAEQMRILPIGGTMTVAVKISYPNVNDAANLPVETKLTVVALEIDPDSQEATSRRPLLVRNELDARNRLAAMALQIKEGAANLDELDAEGLKSGVAVGAILIEALKIAATEVTPAIKGKARESWLRDKAGIGTRQAERLMKLAGMHAEGLIDAAYAKYPNAKRSITAAMALVAKVKREEDAAKRSVDAPADPAPVDPMVGMKRKALVEALLDARAKIEDGDRQREKTYEDAKTHIEHDTVQPLRDMVAALRAEMLELKAEVERLKGVSQAIPISTGPS